MLVHVLLNHKVGKVVATDQLPDGKYVLTAGDVNTARLWQIELHDTLREVCALLTRDLTDDERLQFGISDQGPTCAAQ